MAFKFMVYVDKRKDGAMPMLCEGGIYTDDESILAEADFYTDHTFEKGENDVQFHNRLIDQTYGTYELRDHWECPLHLFDFEVLSSLDKWQKDAMKVSLTDLTPAVLMSPPKKEVSVKDYFDERFPDFNPRDLDRYWTLSHMPIESSCGDDCKAAIDAATAFVEQIRKADGEFPRAKQNTQNVGNMVLDICSVFING